MAVEPNDISSEEYNSNIAGWGSDVAGKIRVSIRSLTSNEKDDLVKSLRMTTHKSYGEIDSVGYKFNHYGVFVHKGVGRGYYMEGGVVVRGNKPGKVLKATALDVNYRLHQQILRSAGVNRKPKPWLNPVIDNNIEKLADMVAEMRSDQAVNATRMHIQ